MNPQNGLDYHHHQQNGNNTSDYASPAYMASTATEPSASKNLYFHDSTNLSMQQLSTNGSSNNMYQIQPNDMNNDFNFANNSNGFSNCQQQLTTGRQAPNNNSAMFEQTNAYYNQPMYANGMNGHFSFVSNTPSGSSMASSTSTPASIHLDGMSAKKDLKANSCDGYNEDEDEEDEDEDEEDDFSDEDESEEEMDDYFSRRHFCFFSIF